MTTRELAKKVMAQAQACDVTLATAESCTAGLLAHVLSKEPGAGCCLRGGFITYTKEMKTHLLGVSASLLEDKTAVCAEVAEAMAKGAVDRTDADIGLAITGVVGPLPDEDGNPVGLVYCAVFSRKMGSLTGRYFFSGFSRDEIIDAAVNAAFRLALKVCV